MDLYEYKNTSTRSESGSALDLILDKKEAAKVLPKDRYELVKSNFNVNLDANDPIQSKSFITATFKGFISSQELYTAKFYDSQRHCYTVDSNNLKSLRDSLL